MLVSSSLSLSYIFPCKLEIAYVTSLKILKSNTSLYSSLWNVFLFHNNTPQLSSSPPFLQLPSGHWFPGVCYHSSVETAHFACQISAFKLILNFALIFKCTCSPSQLYGMYTFNVNILSSQMELKLDPEQTRGWPCSLFSRDTQDTHHKYLEQLPTSKGGQVGFGVRQHFRTKDEWPGFRFTFKKRQWSGW